MARPIIIIGAGIGGLSAAIRLAAAGRQVIIFEQNKSVGGKMSELRAEGYRWDTGPSVITMRHVLEDLFEVANRRLDNFLTLLPVDPLTRYFYPDGLRLDASCDLALMTSQIAALDERDVEGYLAYLAYAARIYRITGPVFIYDEPPSWRSFTRVPPFDVLRIDGLRKMDTAIRAHIRSPYLRQLLGRFATYVGASPFAAPATLNVIAHVELNGGVWYPQGGIYTIAQNLAQLAGELGVKIHTSCPVHEIAVGNHRVQGVTLADGTRQSAEAVIANVDVTTVYQQLLPDGATTSKRLRQLTRVEPSCSGFVLMLGITKQHPDLTHHNIFFSGDYRREFDDIFKRRMPPEEPTIYVAITSKTDPTHAPPRCENWFVLVNAPALDANFDWASQGMAYREQVLDRLAWFGYDLRGAIQVDQMLTPLNLAQHTGAWRGALYGASSNTPWAAFRRPNNRARDLRGLYFAGGTTHPGGGVPLVMLSGRIAANMVLRDT